MDEKLGADLELFKQARLAPGDLRSGAVVTAKVRGVEHANRVLIGDGQGKPCAGLLLHLAQQRRVDPVAGEVEKPDMPRGCGLPSSWDGSSNGTVCAKVRLRF
ncbi:MAG: hypothetical protein QOI97_3839 [Pseudomonas sp.]|jgi:hypothetical protein|nr:hypothetical protein [Pseudomonas sp.]